MSRMLLVITFLAGTAQAGLAQTAEDTPEATAAPRSAEAAGRPSLRVLQDPYDIASFYRSGGSSPEGWAGLASDPAYRIAGFYRSGAQGRSASPYGWSRFWVSGYATPRPRPLAPYSRTIGENGDIFLLVPFLAAVGPISGAFLGY